MNTLAAPIAPSPPARPPALNLLRHSNPRRWPQHLPRLLVAGLLGLTLGTAALLWQGQQDHALRLQSAELQAQLRSLRAQHAQQRNAQAQARLQHQWAQRQSAWQAQNHSLQALHQTLTQQAPSQGLRLLRWQANGRQLELHALLPHAERLPAVLSALAHTGTWTLHSMSTRPGTAVEVVLQTPWPTAPQPPAQAQTQTQAPALAPTSLAPAQPPRP